MTLGAAGTAVLGVITGMQLLNGRMDNPAAAMHAAAALVALLMWVILAALRYAAQARKPEGADSPESCSGLFLAQEIFACLAAIAAAVTGHRFVLGF
jgi:hypothetical protein